MFHELCFPSPSFLRLNLAILVFRLIFLLSRFIILIYNKKNHRWRLELKECLIPVATQAFAFKVSKINMVLIKNFWKLFSQMTFRIKKNILSLLTFILLSSKVLKIKLLWKNLTHFKFFFSTFNIFLKRFKPSLSE